MGQQNLRCADAMASESNFVGLNQPHLSNGGGGLELMHCVRPGFPAQSCHALGYGPTGNEYELAALCVKRGNLGCPLANCLQIDALTFIRDQGGTHFCNNAFGLGDNGSRSRHGTVSK